MPSGKKPIPSAFTKAIAETLRIQKAARRETNASIGRAAGVSGSQISTYLNGSKSPDIEQLDRICIFLDIDLIEDVIAPADELTNSRRYQ